MANFFRTFKPSHKMLHPFDPFVKVFLPMIPRWIKPNHFSAFRIVFTPYLGYLIWTGDFVAGLIWFVVLGLTDMFDGSLARLRDQVTPVGIVLDPIADKLLIGTTVVILLYKIDLLLAAIVIGLELLFLIGGVLHTSTKGTATDLEANIWGKTKMTLQVLGGVLLFAGLITGFTPLIAIGKAVFWAAAAFAVANLFSFSL